MQSVYNSCLPQLNRSLRSSSVERSIPRSYYTSSAVDNSSRYMRAATVGPTDYVYTSAMPFAYEAEKAVERLMARRAASVEPVLSKPFTYTQAYQTGGHGYSAFDYKVNQNQSECTKYCGSQPIKYYKKKLLLAPLNSVHAQDIKNNSWLFICGWLS